MPTPATTDLALRFDHVSLGYTQVSVLHDISLRVEVGQVVAIMGCSGSGKTTILRAATGQLTAQAGSVQVFGQDLAQVSPQDLRTLRQRMGVLFQHGALFTDSNVFDNVAFPLREHTTLPENQLTARVLHTLHAVGLRAAAHLSMAEISGGMARRVALARAVVLEPELIFYDEPFAGLDPISMGITAKLIRDLADRLLCTSVLITHDVRESFSIADEVYLVGEGKLLAGGTPAMLSASQDSHVRQFLSGAPDGPVSFHYPETPAFARWLDQQAELA